MLKQEDPNILGLVVAGLMLQKKPMSHASACMTTVILWGTQNICPFEAIVTWAASPCIRAVFCLSTTQHVVVPGHHDPGCCILSDRLAGIAISILLLYSLRMGAVSYQEAYGTAQSDSMGAALRNICIVRCSLYLCRADYLRCT